MGHPVLAHGVGPARPGAVVGRRSAARTGVSYSAREGGVIELAPLDPSGDMLGMLDTNLRQPGLAQHRAYGCSKCLR